MAFVAQTARVELRCSGYPQLQADGQPVALNLKRGLALVVFLSEPPRRVARALAAELLWPDAPVETGRARLRRLCHRINAAVGVELVAGDADSVWLARDAVGWRSDVAEVRAAATQLLAAPRVAPLQASVACLCNPAAPRVLAGFELDSDGFDEWLRGARAEHERLVVRALAHAAQRLVDEGDAMAAVDAAAALVCIDPLSDLGHALALGARAALGDAAGVDAAYFACAELMRREFGSAPSAQVEAAYAGARERLRASASQAAACEAVAPVRFAETDDGSVAFLDLGDPGAPLGTLLINIGLWSHVELSWEEPRLRTLLRRLARSFHVILMDRRGVGLSERLVERQTVDAGVEDVEAVLRTLGVGRVSLLGSCIGGPIAIEFAARAADRVDALVLYGATACALRGPDNPWGWSPELLRNWQSRLVEQWGGPTGFEDFAPSAAGDAAARAWWARNIRQAASRHSVRAMVRGLAQVDVRAQLPRLAAPTLVIHRDGDRIVRAGAGREIAARVPGAQLLMLPGDDHTLWHGDTEPVLEALEAFVRSARTRRTAAQDPRRRQ